MSFGIKPGEGHHTSISMFEDYPAKTARLSPQEQKQIRKTTKALFETSPSDAISYLAGTRGYTNFRPDLLMGKLMARPVDYSKFKALGAATFQDLLGRAPTEAESTTYTELAKAQGIKDYGAFESFLSGRLASTPEGQSKIKSQADIEWESQYGTMPRDAQGNLVRGMVRYNPSQVKNMIQSMIG